MIDGKERLERRKHKRFQVPSGALVGLGPYFEKVGPIVDISMGGLGFRYVGTKESNGTYLDIFLTNSDFFLRNVPFETVRHLKIVGAASPGSETMREKAVKFGKLTRDQKSQLKYFIENFAVGEA